MKKPTKIEFLNQKQKVYADTNNAYDLNEVGGIQHDIKLVGIKRVRELLY